MVAPCILEMASSSLRNPTRPPEVVALGGHHQPGERDPLAIQGENIWHEEEWQSPIQVLRGWLQD